MRPIDSRKSVAREERLRPRLVERYVARRVARRVDDAQGRLPEVKLGRRFEVDVHRGHRSDGNPEYRAAHRGVLEQEAVLRREGEGDAVLPFEELHAERVVEVAVGVGRQHGVQSVLLDEVAQRRILAVVAVAGVDDGALVRLVPEDVGVLLNRIEGQAGDFHAGESGLWPAPGRPWRGRARCRPGNATKIVHAARKNKQKQVRATFALRAAVRQRDGEGSAAGSRAAEGRWLAAGRRKVGRRGNRPRCAGGSASGGRRVGRGRSDGPG